MALPDLSSLVASARMQHITWPAAPVSAAQLASLPAAAIAVATSGSAQAVERARTALELDYPYRDSPNTIGEIGASRSSAETVLGYQRLADVVVLLSLPTAGCTLAASAAAGLADRKRPFSMLRLTGGSLAMLRRVVLLETAVPLLAVGITRHHRCHVPPPGPHYRARGSQKRMTPIRRARRCQAAEPAVGKFGSRPENRTSDRIGNQGQEQPGHHQLLGAAQGQLPNWDRARAPEVQCPEGPDHGPGFLLARRRTRGCDRGGGPSEPSWLPVSLQAHRQLRNDLFSELGDPRTAVPPIPEGAAQ